MSVEVMKQALAALEVSTDWDVNATGKQAQSMRAINALRTAIEQAEEQEPVAYEDKFPEMLDEIQRLRAELKFNTVSQNREWVGLTDEEIEQAWEDASPYYNETDFARAIEAKLKEKNT